LRLNNELEVQRWLIQSERDLAAASTLGLNNQFYAQSCFWSQQATEKALRALQYFLEGQSPRSYEAPGTAKLIEEIARYYPQFRKYGDDVRVLDQYYESARYPLAQSEEAPYQIFSQSQAEEAVQMAGAIIDEIKSAISQQTQEE
jgi:HEPN domain-containing protein